MFPIVWHTHKSQRRANPGWIDLEIMAAAAATAATDAVAATATDTGAALAAAAAAAAEGSTRLLDAHDTVLTPCALETCCWPTPDAEADACCWVVCGTYQLVKGPEGTGSAADSRKGSLQLYQLGAGGEKLIPRQALALEEEGVLDCKWRPSAPQDNSPPLLACATSQGRIAMYALHQESSDSESEGGGWQLAAGPASSAPCADEDGERRPCMALALDWSRDALTVASSNNDGSACVHRFGEEELEEVARWDAHDLGGSPIEVWTTTFADRAGNLLLTGADDCRLKAWDLRCLDPACPTPLWTDARSHGAGVTSLQAFGGEDGEESWYFASGSYDGVLRLWDRRKALRPVLTQEMDVGGGVWRIKWREPTHSAGGAGGGERLLALACMHAGAAVLRFGEEDGGVLGAGEEVARHTGHQSMAYGIDWCGLEGGSSSNQMLLASCSFYDHALHLWAPAADD